MLVRVVWILVAILYMIMYSGSVVTGEGDRTLLIVGMLALLLSKAFGDD